MNNKNITIGVTVRNIELYALVAEMEGMKAENAFREMQGYNVAYGMDEFYELAQRMRALIDNGEEKADE